MSRNGSFRLFQLAGIDVYVHWSWLLVAFFQVQYRQQFSRYDRPAWYWIEYLSLFGIVLMHEFGHALACRQVGGIANYIVLWPLGGVAYVNPPPQSGGRSVEHRRRPLGECAPHPDHRWLVDAQRPVGWEAVYPRPRPLHRSGRGDQLILLIFNMLPVYPLDGGQILQSLLWFMMGRATSLMVVSIIGMLVGGGVLILALLSQGGSGFGRPSSPRSWRFALSSAFSKRVCWRAFSAGRATRKQPALRAAFRRSPATTGAAMNAARASTPFSVADSVRAAANFSG